MRTTKQRPDSEVKYLTIYDVNGNERYVEVEDVYLPGDAPEEQCSSPS